MHLPQFDNLGRRILNPVTWELILSQSGHGSAVSLQLINRAIVTSVALAGDSSPVLRFFWGRETALPCPPPLLFVSRSV